MSKKKISKEEKKLRREMIFNLIYFSLNCSASLAIIYYNFPTIFGFLIGASWICSFSLLIIIMLELGAYKERHKND